MKDMKRTCIAICAVLALVSATAASAQTRYPDPVAAVFNAADASVKGGLPSAPVIAVPLGGCCEKDIFEAVTKSGGVPVGVPADITDFNLLRDAAASFDGFMLTDSFKGMMDAEAADSTAGELRPGLELIKAVVDRNVPVYGSSDLLASIEDGLIRSHAQYPSMDAFISKAGTYKKAKALMQRIFVLDSHNDQPCEYREGASIGLRQSNLVSVPKMVEGYKDGAMVVSWIAQRELDEEHTSKAVKRCEWIIDQVHRDVEKYPDVCGIATTEAEARALKVQGKKALFIGVENGYGIGTDLSLIKKYRDKGMIYMTLCHSGDNAICHTSAGGSHEGDEGVTKFGKKVIKELNRCGVVIDLSHANEASFWDAVRLSKSPIVCTHSGAAALYGHDRNLTDEQLKALARTGGVCQVYIVSGFMSDDPSKFDIDLMIDHLMHCIDVAGIDHVGIGTDFDGGGVARDINGDNDMVNITVKLLERGLSEEDIEKVWGVNFFRVLGQAQKLAVK